MFKNKYIWLNIVFCLVVNPNILSLIKLNYFIALLLCLTIRKKEAIQPVKPLKNFVIEKKTNEHDEEEIEREIQSQLQARQGARNMNEIKKQEPVPLSAEPKLNYAPQIVEFSNDNQENPSSKKKVVKKRIVKMMKDGKLVAEKEEILDEEGNVLRTEIRKEGNLLDDNEISG